MDRLGYRPRFLPLSRKKERGVAFGQPLRWPGLIVVLMGVPVVAGQPCENLALHKKYTLWPAPKFSYTNDPNDATQLTDGRAASTNERFWMQKETVGWAGIVNVAITVDLGRVEPISGVSFRTAAGSADVEWPTAIHVLVSEDGKQYRYCGDLVTLDVEAHGPLPEGYAIRELTTCCLRTRGRYVRFIVCVAPMVGAQARFIFSDEVQVFRGPAELLQGEPGGQPVPDAERFLDSRRIQFGVKRRFAADIAAVQEAIDTANLAADSSVRLGLRNQWKAASNALRSSTVVDDATFRAVVPLNEAHSRLFAVQAAVWKAQGRANLAYGVPATWDPTDANALPLLGGQIEVHTMRGEYRAAAVNLANASTAPIDARVRFEGLPDSPTPKYIVVHEVPWTDTYSGQLVAAALPLARRDGDAWRISVLPGLVRQVWLTFHVERMPPGEYSGSLIVEGPQNEALRVPVRLRVYPLDFPRETTLLLGGFDYLDGNATGIASKNLEALVAHLRERFVNVPWASASVLMQCDFAADGTVKLNTRAMDNWLAQWPHAKAYYVFLARRPPDVFGGAEQGTAEFNRKVGAWISAWVCHLGTKGIRPEQLALHIQDEPKETTDVGAILAWAKAVHAAEPKVRIWVNPVCKDPSKAPVALFDACDILCPNRSMWLKQGEPFARFYCRQQQKGRTLHLYSCDGPTRLLDPYSYYRLQAWHCCQIGATGSFFWTFAGNKDRWSWNEYLATKGVFTPEFLDDTGVVAGKQMEAIREGVEDFEYFVLLRNAVAKAKVAGRSDAALVRAESLLATAADEVLGAHGADMLHWHEPKDRTKADVMRIKMLEALSALR